MALGKVQLLNNTGVTAGSYTSADLTVSADGRITAVSNGGGFTAGTRLVFHQSSAPTGWTTDSSFNDYALRVVSSGGGGSGGSTSFTGSFNTSIGTSGGSVQGTSIDGNTMVAHNHGFSDPGHYHSMRWTQRDINDNGGGRGDVESLDGQTGGNSSSPTTQVGTNISFVTQGNSQAHSHGFTNPSLSLNVRYVNVIIGVKS
jgi:hypothetical protein